jgi:type 1 fimbria pilin
MACIHRENPVRSDQTNCNDCDKTSNMPDIFQHLFDKMNNINDKSDNVKMISSTNQNQNVLITVKNGNASHRSFWHLFPYDPTQPHTGAAPPELEVSLYLY